MPSVKNESPDESPEPIDASGSEALPEAAEPGQTVESDGSEAPADDVRARYREALARKTGRGSGSGGGTVSGNGGARAGGSGPAKAQRTFRRKSGG